MTNQAGGSPTGRGKRVPLYVPSRSHQDLTVTATVFFDDPVTCTRDSMWALCESCTAQRLLAIGPRESEICVGPGQPGRPQPLSVRCRGPWAAKAALGIKEEGEQGARWSGAIRGSMRDGRCVRWIRVRVQVGCESGASASCEFGCESSASRVRVGCGSGAEADAKVRNQGWDGRCKIWEA